MQTSGDRNADSFGSPVRWEGACLVCVSKSNADLVRARCNGLVFWKHRVWSVPHPHPAPMTRSPSRRTTMPTPTGPTMVHNTIAHVVIRNSRSESCESGALRAICEMLCAQK